MRRFRIRTSTHDDSSPPPAGKTWDLGIIGEDSQIDARSTASCDFVRACASTTLTLRFDAANHKNELRLDGQVQRLSAVKARLSGATRVLVEATSLTFPELLYVIDASTSANVSELRFVYVEPRDYRRDVKGGLNAQRNFELSENRRYQGIHNFQTNLSELEHGQAVFFLGFEGSRLGQALEQQEVLHKWRKHAVFGVPAFSPGWEIDAMANNVQHLSPKYEIQYAAAASASAAYDLLSRLLEQDKEDHPMLVAPLGTKPHALGAALFVIEHNSMDRAVPLFDHPTRSLGRSSLLRRWHFYDVADQIRQQQTRAFAVAPPS